MEVADIVCSFPEHLPCVVLSAMGKVRLLACHHDVIHACLLAPTWAAHRSGFLGRGLVPVVCGFTVLSTQPNAWHARSSVNNLPTSLALPPPQTTNLLLQCGEEALRTDAANIRSLAPLK